MPISIKNPEAEQLVRQVADLTGESLTEAILVALRERHERLAASKRRRSLADELDRIAKRCAALPVLDSRPADEILGYDENGLPR